MFHAGDKVVHPMHGAGIIDGIVTEKIGRDLREYYVFKMPVGGLVLKIPVATSDVIGLRDIISPDAAEELITELPELHIKMTSNWNRRYRENMDRLKSGDVHHVAEVIVGLTARDADRGLSTGERKMLHTAKQILISELVLSTGKSYEDIENNINAAVAGEITG